MYLNYFVSESKHEEPMAINDSMRQLEGHFHRITALSWSVHQDGMLASASYDGTAQVSNILPNQILFYFLILNSVEVTQTYHVIFYI